MARKEQLAFRVRPELMEFQCFSVPKARPELTERRELLVPLDRQARKAWPVLPDLTRRTSLRRATSRWVSLLRDRLLNSLAFA
jgi:hypothetical protein